ncbi:hypothetical protein MYE70_10360 [Marinobacter alexandrii]|uniref:hypothetical protein n=1 Tax=Marinobacter alexandrii TaxID=2570351 RepID=UPI001FFFD0A3|nr:hypothetical protein [Marinobacter alexandrii]MCK2149468.1 hypothetical protein [Marinobacter alexandrii]
MRERKQVYGWGINDADYPLEPVVNGKRQRCNFFLTWRRMIWRCYDGKRLKEYPSYIGCSVAEEWKRFSDFKAWMVEQDWVGKHLDKDIICPGNKVYSSQTCVFVHPTINNFFTDAFRLRGEFMIGVRFHKGKRKFQGHCSNPFTKKVDHLGYFDREIDAHLAWLRRKNELAIQLSQSDYVTDDRVADALRSRYAQRLRQQADQIEAEQENSHA